MRKGAWCALFVLEAVLFFRHVLFSDRVIPWDLQGFHMPHAYLYADAVARGELPLWDPYTYCGRPFQANIQTQVFYPTVALAAWLGSWWGHRHLFFLLELNVILHTALAGMLAFRLGRVLGLGTPAALLLGSVYQMGAFFALHAEHMGAVTIAAWMPLAWAGVFELARAPSWRALLRTAFALAMAVLGGLAPLTAVVAASVVLLALLLAVWEKASWRLPVLVGAAGLAAALLTAVQLVPTMQLTGHSIARHRAAWLASGGGAPVEALVTMVWPNYWGAFDLSTYRLNAELTFSYLYCGLGALGLALAGAFVWRRRHAVFAALAVLTGLAMLGENTMAGRTLYLLLPVKVRIGLHPEYTMPAFLLSVAVLAALGMERWVPRRFAWLALAVCVGDLLAVTSGRPWHAMKQPPPVTREAFEGYPESVVRLRNLAYQADPPWRYDTVHGAMTWAMQAPTLAIPTANGNDPMALERLIRARLAFTPGERWGAYYEPKNLASAVLDMLGVRCLVSRERLSARETGGSAWTLAGDVPGYSIYENPRALPRFRLVGKIVHAGSEDEAARYVYDARFAPEREAVVEQYGGPPVAPAVEPGRVRVVSYGLREVVLETDAAQPAFLATAEAHFPGWRASIDGAGTTLYYTNLAFRGLAVPAGRHTVVMRFVPAVLFWSGGVSALAWMVWVWLWRRGRRQPAAGGQP